MSNPTVRIFDFTPIIHESKPEKEPLVNYLSLDGVDDYLEIPHNNSLSFANQFTIETWVNPAEIKNDWQPLVTKQRNDGLERNYGLYIIPNTLRIASSVFNTGNTNYGVDSQDSLVQNQWNHIAMVADGSTLKLYVNGKLQGSENISGTLWESTHPVKIGKEISVYTPFSGEIDDVRIWNVARTEAEIQQNQNQALNGNEAGLVGYWSLNESNVSGNTVRDLTSNGNDGNLKGGVKLGVDSSSFIGYVDIAVDAPVTNAPGLVVNYIIEGDSQAIQGVDFYGSQVDVSTTDGLPATNSIFIPKGEDTARIYFTALPDAVVEGEEQIKFTLLPDFNNAVSLNGSGDYVEININEPETEITHELWFKTTDANTGIFSIVNGGASDRHLYLNSGNIYARVYSSEVINSSGINLADGEWHHLAHVIGSSVGGQKLYIDGELVASGNKTSSDFTWQTQASIGLSVDAVNDYFNGEIDEVRIWNKARTQEEIRDNRYTQLTGNETNLLGYWNFNVDKINGSTINDVSSNNNNGTLVTSNKVLSVDGSGDYVEVNINEPETEITHELWFKTTDANTGIFSITSGTVGVSTASDRHLYLDNGNIYARVFSNEVINSSGLNLADGKWHHVAHVIGNSVGGQKLYINGELVASGTKAFSDFSSQTKALIGHSLDATNDYFNGEIDEVRIWNQARTQEQIRQSKDITLAGNEAGLIGYWNFNSSNANDSAGSNNGTLQGNATTISGGRDKFVPSVSKDTFAVNGNYYKLDQNRQAIALDGVDDYVNAGTDNSLKLTNAFTIEAWVKPESNNFQILLNKEGEYEFAIDATGKVHYAIANTNPGWAWVDTGYQVNFKEWTHLAFTYDASNLKTYANGQLVSTKTATGNIGDVATTQNELRIGDRTATSDPNFKGEIDEVRIWNTTRTQEQIQQNFDRELTGNEAGLVGYWNFNSNTVNNVKNNVITDLSSNSNNGTLIGNKVLSLDGVNDRVEIPNSSSINFAVNQNFTVESWVKADPVQANTDNGDNDIIEKWGVGGGGYPFVIRYDRSTGQIIAARYDGSNGPGIVSTATINDGQFHHVAFIKDGSNLKLYIDGQLEGTTTDTTTGDTTNTSPLFLGSRNTDNYFKGELDELRIWNVARTETEIQQNLYTTFTGDEAGLVSYYKFEDNTANDILGNNNGTLQNGASVVSRNLFLSTRSTDPSVTFSVKDSTAYQAGIAYADSFGDEINNANKLYPDSQGNSSFQVKLTSKPTGNVTVALSTPSGSLDKTSLTFNTNNWETYQTVNVSGLGSINSSFNITSTATSNDSNYNSLSSTLGVLTAPPSNTTKINVTEGGIVEPDPVITANIVAQDAQEGQIEPGTFTITLSDPAPKGGLKIPFTVSGTAGEGTDYRIGTNKKLVLDGIDDRVVIPDSNAIDFAFNQNFTVESWVKANPNQGNSSIMEKWGVGGGGYPFIIRYSASGQIIVARYDGSNNPFIASTATINDGQFHHVAFVKDGSNLKLYVDGQLQGTTPDTTTGNTTNISPVFLGSVNNTNYFKGELDEVRIWNVARTEAEIQQNLNKSLTGNEAGLVGYWNFRNDTGSTAKDLTSNNNNGTLENGASFSNSSNPNLEKFITIPEGQKSATININSINNDIEQGNKNITVSLNGITDDKGNNLSASLNIVDDEKSGVAFAQLNTVGTLDIPAIKLNVTTAYNSGTGNIGLQISGGADSYTFANATKFTLTNGTEVTIPANTTINSTSTTVNVGNGLGAIPVNETSISEMKLVDVNLLSFTQTGNNATANVQARLTQAPAAGETVTLKLKDANGSDFVDFTFNNSNWNQYQKTDISNFLDLTANNSTFGLNAQTTSTATNSNYKNQNITLPVTTSINTTPLSINNTSGETKLVTSEGEKIELSVTTAYDSTNNQVELELINRSTNYTLKANDVITFANGTTAQVTTDTTLTPGTAKSVSVTLTSGTVIPKNQAGAISLNNPSQTSFAVKLSSKPSSDVTLNLNLTDATEGEFTSNNGQATTLTFTTTNWNQYQEINVKGKDDSIVDGNITYKVKVEGANSNGDTKYRGSLGELKIVNEDKDTIRENIAPNASTNAAITSYIASLSVNSTEVTEDGTVSATVNLNQAAPTGGLHVRYQIADVTTTPWQDVKTPLVSGIENPLSAARKLSVYDILPQENWPNVPPVYVWAPGSIPNLVDLNNDGNLEAFIGESVYNNSPNNWATGIDYYEQVSGVFQKQSINNPFSQFNTDANGQTLKSLAPAFGDIDGDGDIDAVVGDLFGNLHYLKNIGDANNPNFQKQTGNANPLAAVTGSNHLVPALVDIDNDGDLDFFGSFSGAANIDQFTPPGFPFLGISNIVYFENTGTTTNPLFIERTGNSNPFNNLTIPNGAALVFGDMDEDGDLDGLSGTSDGTIAYYRNIGNAQHPVFVAPEYNPLAGIDVGNISRLALADIDKDSDLDIFIGNYDGEIKFYENNSSITEVYIPEGQTSVDITVNLNDDKTSENSEKFALQLVDRIDGTVTLNVSAAYQLISVPGKSFNAVGLQVNSSDNLDTYTLPKGTILTFGNGAKVTVDENTSVNKTASVLVPVTLTSGTEILVGETTTINKSDYQHKIIDLNVVSAFDSATNSNLQLKITTTGLTSYTLKQGTQLDFVDSNRNILSVTVNSDTNIDNSAAGVSVPITVLAKSSAKNIAANTTTSVLENQATITILDNDISGIRITTDSAGNNRISGTYTTTEAGNGTPKTFYARLETQPEEPVFVYVATSNSQEGTVAYKTISDQQLVRLAFDRTNWQIPQAFTVTGVNDDIDDGNVSYKIITTVESEDFHYRENSVKLDVTQDYANGAVNLQINDLNIEKTKLLAGTKLNFSNGTIATVNSSVDVKNSGATSVNVTLESNALGLQATTTNGNLLVTQAYNPTKNTVELRNTTATPLTLNAADTITFTNGAVLTVNNTITLSENSRDIVNATLTTAANTITSGLTTAFTEDISPDIQLSNTDDDIAGIVLENFENIAAKEGIANNFYKVKLPTKPIGTVEVTMTPTDDEIALEGKFAGESLTITFDETNWKTAQTIGVTAVDDFDIEFDHTSFINFDTSGSTDTAYQNIDLTNTQVKVNITDNDLPTASVKAVAGAIEANAPGYFVITLDKPLPKNFDDTGLVINYTIGGSADTDGVNPTDDLQPITGTARIAPGERRTPLIAFPIDDFKVEGVPLDITTAYNNGTIQLKISDKADVNIATLNAGTKLTFSNGAIATVDSTVTDLSKTGSKTVNLTFTNDSPLNNIPNNETTRIPAETVSVTITNGDGYNISGDQNTDTLEIIDNDVPGIRIVEPGERTTVTEGAQPGEYFISLLSEPSGTVTVNINPQQTNRELIVTTAYNSSNGTVELKVNNAGVDSLQLKAGTVLDFGSTTATVSQDTLINSNTGASVNVSLTSGTAIATNTTTSISYDELSTTSSLTFNSNNWYKLQAVQVSGIDDNVVEVGKTHTSTIKYDITSTDNNYNRLKVPAQTIDIIDRPFDRDNTVQSLTQGFLAFQDSINTATLPIIGNLNGVAPSFITDILDSVITDVRGMETVTGDKITKSFKKAFNNRVGNNDSINVQITDLSSNNLAFLVNAKDSIGTQIGLGSDLGLAALGLNLQTQGNLDATFDYNLDFAFGINDTDGFYIDTTKTNFNVNAGVNLDNNFSAKGSLGFLEADFTNGIDAASGDNQGTGVNAIFDIGFNSSQVGDNNTLLNLTELNNLRKNKQLASALDYGFSGDAALDLNVKTSFAGNNAFPSFSFNLFSELPLFNYTDDTQVPENPVTITKKSGGQVKEATVTNITINATGLPSQNLALKKGTQLTFGQNKVIVQEKVSLTEATDKVIKVKLLGKDKNNLNETATIANNSAGKLAVSSLDLSFNNIQLDFGSFVTGVVSPVVGFLDDIITPIEPVVTALNSPIGFLKDIGLSGQFDSNGDGQATILEVAENVLNSVQFNPKNKIDYVKFFDAIVGVIDLVNAVKDIKTSLDSGENFGIDFGDYTLQSFRAASKTANIKEINPKTNGSSNLKSNTKNQAKNKKGNNNFGQKVDKLFASLDKLGISLPILEDPLTAVNLFLGRDIDLLTYDMPELDINFNINKSFPIFPPLFGVIEGGFNIFSDLVFGFDTAGLSTWEKTGFDPAKSYLIFDGIYLSDVDPNTGVDVDELTAEATLGIGGKLNAVIASASAIGGIRGQVGLDVVDIGEYNGTSDGKVRGSEVISRINNPLSLFELAGSIEAFFKAVVKIGVDLGFFEITKTVFEKELARVPLFEFSLDSQGFSGRAASGYINGATVFLDANFNEQLDPGEPSTTTNELGEYNLTNFDSRLFDINANGIIDDNEAQIVAIGGVDITTNLPLETPLIASGTNGSILSPITTIKTELKNLGMDADEAEELLLEALGLEVDIDEFDPYEAEGDELLAATKTSLAHILIHSLIVNGTAFLKGVGVTENVNQIVTQSIVKVLQSPEEVELDEAEGIELLFNLVLETAEIDTIESETVKSVAQLIGSMNDFMADLLESEMEEDDDDDDDDDDDEKEPTLNDVLPKITPLKNLVLDEIPELVTKLSAEEINLEQTLELFNGELNKIGFKLVKEEEEEDDGTIEIEYEIQFADFNEGEEKPTDKPMDGEEKPLPIIDSEDDKNNHILPKKLKKLARGKLRENLLSLDSDDLTDTKIKFSLTSKNLPLGRVHEIAIFVTDSEDGTINGLLPEDANYKEAALEKARSIFSILPDNFITNPSRILKGFASQNIGFLLIKNGTVDSARRGRTSLENILLGTEKQGDAFQSMQISETGENSFRLSFEDQLGNADFTDIVIDAQLTEETPLIGTDTQGQNEGETLDLRNYSGKQIRIEAPIVREESAYENVVGFYITENLTGTVRDPLTGNLINPGEQGYTKAALRNSQNNAFQMDETGMSGSREIKGGHIFAPFVIADGTLEQVLDDNPNNDPQVFFAYSSANTDGVDHIINLGGNAWGVEDLLGGGDMDHNDVVFKLDLTIV